MHNVLKKKVSNFEKVMSITGGDIQSFGVNLWIFSYPTVLTYVLVNKRIRPSVPTT